MTEEVKEILDNVKKCCEVVKDENFVVYQKQDIIKLLNYITNLQKENENLKEKVHNQKLANAYATIQINKLQTRLKTYKRRKTAETQKKRIYKQRNKKAVEYIKKDTRWFDSEYAKIYGMLCDCEGAKGDRLEVLVNPSNLLNILQGGDE